MRKHGIGMLSYQQLQEEFSISLKKDFDSNKDKFPLSTLLKRASKQMEWDYYPKYIVYLIIVILFLPFLIVLKDYFYLGLIVSFSWVTISSILFYLFSGVPAPQSLYTLKENVTLVSDSCKHTKFTTEEGIQMLLNINNNEEVKSEILLQKYYDFVVPTFKEDKSKDITSSPLNRLMCHQIINQVSKIPISDKETRLLVASQLRIGSKALSDHVTVLNSINSIVDSGNPKEQISKFDPKMIDDVNNTLKILKLAEKRAEFILERLNKIDQLSKN